MQMESEIHHHFDVMSFDKESLDGKMQLLFLNYNN